MASEILNEFSQDITPEIFTTLSEAGLLETIDILSETVGKDTGGANIKSVIATAYTGIPAKIKRNSAARFVIADKPIAYGNYLFTFPMVKTDGTRINLTPSHRLKVLTRGLEPVKNFQIVNIFENSAGFYTVEAKKES